MSNEEFMKGYDLFKDPSRSNVGVPSEADYAEYRRFMEGQSGADKFLFRYRKIFKKKNTLSNPHNLRIVVDNKRNKDGNGNDI